MRFLILLALLLNSVDIWAADPSAAKSIAGWPGVKYTKVVGYYFQPAAEVAGEFSTIDAKGFHPEVLAKYQVQEKTLQPAQIGRFLRASFASKIQFGRAACYAPHHAFVFYNEAGEPVAACEFCLSCKGFVTWPREKDNRERDGGSARNYVELALLSAELGLKLGELERPLKKVISDMREELRAYNR